MLKALGTGLVVVVLASFGGNTEAAPIIDQNFDSFPVGDFSGGIPNSLGNSTTTAGQWFDNTLADSGNIAISTERAFSGAQSFKIVRGSTNNVFGRRQTNLIDQDAVDGVRLSFYINRVGTQDSAGLLFLTGDGASSGFNFSGSIAWNADGVVSYSAGPSGTLTATTNTIVIPDDVWTRVDLLYEFATSAAGSLTISTTRSDTGITNNLGTFAFTGYSPAAVSGLNVFLHANSTIYLDNVQLEAVVPEPGSLGVLGLAVGCSTLRRRTHR